MRCRPYVNIRDVLFGIPTGIQRLGAKIRPSEAWKSGQLEAKMPELGINLALSNGVV